MIVSPKSMLFCFLLSATTPVPKKKQSKLSLLAGLLNVRYHLRQAVKRFTMPDLVLEEEIFRDLFNIVWEFLCLITKRRFEEAALVCSLPKAKFEELFMLQADSLGGQKWSVNPSAEFCFAVVDAFKPRIKEVVDYKFSDKDKLDGE